MDTGNKKNRKDLKTYFIRNSVPTEGNFADLIDGMLNQQEDGIVKPSVNDPLCIAAVGDANGLKKVINFYEDFNKDHAAWSLLLNPSPDGSESSASKKSGLCLADGATNMPRLYIDSTTGNIGVKTVNPIAPLDIAQELRTGSSHPKNLLGLYVTGNFDADNNGVEFRKSDASQGIGFGYNTIYAAGSDNDQPLHIKAKGVSPVRIVGATNICDALVGDTISNELHMASGSLTIGSVTQSYGGSPNQWSTNTAGLLLQTKANTEIVVNEEQVRLASFMYYEGGNDFRITLGRDMGKGTTPLTMAGVLQLESRLHGSNNNPIDRPLREQLVHRRVLYGLPGHSPFDYSDTLMEIEYVYGPFRYGVPPAQTGAIRKFRLYAIYTDTMTTSGQTEITFNFENGSGLVFNLALTYGSLDYKRDSFSNWIPANEISGLDSHGRFYIRCTVPALGRLWYLELHAYDFFE